VGRCIATRIFLATSWVLMRAIRRNGGLHLEQRSSKPNVLLNNSAHGMYPDLPAGSSGAVRGGGVDLAGAGTTWLQEEACQERTPK